jgi:hypothetical protein
VSPPRAEAADIDAEVHAASDETTPDFAPEDRIAEADPDHPPHPTPDEITRRAPGG